MKFPITHICSHSNLFSTQLYQAHCSSKIKLIEIPTTRIRYIYFFSSFSLKTKRCRTVWFIFDIDWISTDCSHDILWQQSVFQPKEDVLLSEFLSFFFSYACWECDSLWLRVRQLDVLAFVLHFQSAFVGNIYEWIMEALKCEMFNMDNIGCVCVQFSLFAMLAEHRTGTMQQL